MPHRPPKAKQRRKAWVRGLPPNIQDVDRHPDLQKRIQARQCYQRWQQLAADGAKLPSLKSLMLTIPEYHRIMDQAEAELRQRPPPE